MSQSNNNPSYGSWYNNHAPIPHFPQKKQALNDETREAKRSANWTRHELKPPIAKGAGLAGGTPSAMPKTSSSMVPFPQKGSHTHSRCLKAQGEEGGGESEPWAWRLETEKLGEGAETICWARTRIVLGAFGVGRCWCLGNSRHHALKIETA